MYTRHINDKYYTTMDSLLLDVREYEDWVARILTYSNEIPSSIGVSIQCFSVNYCSTVFFEVNRWDLVIFLVAKVGAVLTARSMYIYLSWCNRGFAKPLPYQQNHHPLHLITFHIIKFKSFIFAFSFAQDSHAQRWYIWSPSLLRYPMTETVSL